MAQNLKTLLQKTFSEHKKVAAPAMKIDDNQMLYVKLLNVGSFSDYLQKADAWREKNKGQSDSPYLLSLILCDEQGNSLFDGDKAEDLEFLASLPCWVWTECNKAFNLANFGKKPEEEQSE